MVLRPYDSSRDRPATQRIWRETGWISKGEEEAMSRYVESGHAAVAEINGEAECLVCTSPGTIRYLEEELPFVGVTGVTTSRIARKQGFAARLLARSLAEDVQRGALVAGLGMFEQGFYDNLGFGTLSYEIILSFDPAHLTVPTCHSVPERILPTDFEAMHAARLRRSRGHGGVNLYQAEMTRCEMEEEGKGFGLGFRDKSGEISHAIWVRPKEIESGPYRVLWSVWSTREQFLELMSVIKSWGDQVHSVRIHEAPAVQIQDLLRQPIKHRRTTGKGDYSWEGHAIAYFQARVLDLEGCLRKTHIAGDAIRFNLRLADPIARYLDAETSWRGVAGDYVVTMGPDSTAVRGIDPSLPTLDASVNAFTRLWLGVRPASGLVITDDLAGPPQLVGQLDSLLRLPRPWFDWDF